MTVRGESQIGRLAPEKERGFFRWIDAIRGRLRRGLEAGIPDGAERHIILAMILGYRKGVGDEISRNFRITNTMHILSISGLHVAFFYLMVNGLLRFLHVGKRVSALIAIPLIAAYALITGLAVPVVRSSVMFIAFLSAPFFSRERDTVNSLGVAALVLLAVNPLQLFDAGFQLSFLAVLSILLFAQPIADGIMRIWPCRASPGQLLVSRVERIRWYLGKRLILLCAASTATWLGMTPLIARYFHVMTPMGLLGNVVVIPAGLAIVCLGFSAALASLISSHLAALFNVLNYCVVWLMLASVKYIGRIPCSWRYVAAPGPVRIILYYGLLAFVYFAWSDWWRENKRRLALLGVALCMLLPFAFPAAKTQMRIVFLDVGQGDATYCEFPGGESLLIDGGPDAGVLAGGMIVRPFLHSLGRSGVDTVLLTHAHDDHVDGLFTVLREFSVQRLVLGGSAPAFDNCRRLLGLAQANKIKVYRIARGDRLAEGESVIITALNPGDKPLHGVRADPNNDSVALMLEYGKIKILLCGDMEKEAEDEVCRYDFLLRADVLRVGHHGGRSSSTEKFLKRVLPKWAIVSAGENNRFGHPSPEALARLRERGCTVLRTDLHGAITITTDGKKIDVSTFR
jgi:competence protein ComEC